MSITASNGLANLPRPNYEYITKTEDALRSLEQIERHPIIELDTEATGLDPLSEKVVLIQIGVIGKAFVFDVRDGNVNALIFKDLLESNRCLKLIQNALFDYKMLKTNFGISMNRMYCTMLAEQLIYLGLNPKANLPHLVAKYLRMLMPKEIATSFMNYMQKYQEYQLRYAANDVTVLRDIYNLQFDQLKAAGLIRSAKLEFDFIKPLAEMELNGIILDTNKWNELLDEKVVERDRLRMQISDILNQTVNQSTLFGVSLLNLDSPAQLLKSLSSLGISLNSTDVGELKKHRDNPVVKMLLDYRKHEKFVTTYGEPMINRIHSKTGRLHTNFTQMVRSGRLSSSNPNLQNIPKEQKYRSCFVARPGYKLITCDMSQAELRIIADYSRDPAFLEAFDTGKDLHTRTAADILGISIEEVKKEHRNIAKAINFGLAYGLTKVGLARRLEITENVAQDLISKYFTKYNRIKRYLDQSGKMVILNRYSTTISGRRRYYSLPDPDDPKFLKMKGVIERAGKNTPIQGCVSADTVVKGQGRIESLVDKVINFNTGWGDLNKAEGVYSGRKFLYKLKLSNGVFLKITEDHKIPVMEPDNDMPVDKCVKDIEIDKDMLFVPLGVVKGKKSDVKGYNYEKSHWRETYVDYKYPDFMNPKLSFVIGCLIGDGNYSRHDYFHFVCNEKEKELFNKYNKYVKELFGYDPVLDKVNKKNSVLLTSQVSSVVLRGFLKHVGLDYVINRKKSVPDLFFTESLENRGCLLDGLFSTDGGVTSQSGPNFTTTSNQLANDVQQLLFSIGINSNLKTYVNEYGDVYRIQIPKRFIVKFLKYVGASVNRKFDLLMKEQESFTGKDNSIVPDIVPQIVFESIRNSNIFDKLTKNQKAHLFRFKKGSCSFTSWRKYYDIMQYSAAKQYLSFFTIYDFCKAVSLEKMAEADAYDLICEYPPHYFIANGVVIHNSNADTMKQAMIYTEERIRPYDAKLLLTVHDEEVVEVREDQVEEVAPIVSQCLVDGFGEFFSRVKMEADALIGDCWLKG